MSQCSSYVYFIHAPSERLIKIGYSAESPDGRFYVCQSASPAKVERLALLRGSYGFEQLLHFRFEAAHSHLEWFHATGDLRAFIGANAVPWAGPKVRNKWKNDLPASCDQDAIARCDPWFAELAKGRAARFVVCSDRVLEDHIQADRIATYLLGIPFTAGVFRKTLAGLRGPKEKPARKPRPDTDARDVVLKFCGGPADAEEYEYNRMDLRYLLRKGISVLAPDGYHRYLVAAPFDPKGWAGETIAVSHRGPSACPPPAPTPRPRPRAMPQPILLILSRARAVLVETFVHPLTASVIRVGRDGRVRVRRTIRPRRLYPGTG